MSDEYETWTDDERRALDALERTGDPGRPLEERTVAALRARGLLAPAHAHPRVREGHRYARLHPAWWAAAAAAAVAVFFAGMTVGHARGARSAGELVVALRAADAAERAALVQHTGSLYVEALAGLAEAQAVGDHEAVTTGTEVARAALVSASLELARLHPNEARWGQILTALGATPGAAEGDGSGTTTDADAAVRRVLWF